MRVSNGADRLASPVTQWRWWWPFVLVCPLLASGYVKAAGLVEWSPVDFTALSLALVGGVALVQLPRVGLDVGGLMPLLLVACVVLLGSFRAAPSLYSEVKLQQFLFLTLAACVAISVLVHSHAGLASFSVSWLGMGALAVVTALPSFGSLGTTVTYAAGPVLDPSGRLHVGDAGSGTAGGVGYCAATGLIFVAMGLAQGHLRRAVAIPLALVFAVFTVGSASRGAILGLAAAAVTDMALRPRLGPILKFAVPAASAAIAVLMVLPSTLFQRFSLNDPAREQLWSDAWNGFAEQPLLGNGFGSYADKGNDLYPHNLFLEVAYELGLLGLVALTLVLVLACRNVWRYRHQRAVPLLGVVTVFWLAGSMVSLDIRNRGLWITLTLCLTLPWMLRDRTCHHDGGSHAGQRNPATARRPAAAAHVASPGNPRSFGSGLQPTRDPVPTPGPRARDPRIPWSP